MRALIPAFTASLCLAPAAAAADDITDALTAAIEAYRAGEITDALGQVAEASELLNGLQANGLNGFLPAPLEGWTREITDDSNEELGLIGGGVAAEALYQRGALSFTLTLITDSPMVIQMDAMLTDSALMATMGRVEEINGEIFLNAEGDLSGLVGNRVLIQASGGHTWAVIAHLEQMDFEALAAFGQ